MPYRSCVINFADSEYAQNTSIASWQSDGTLNRIFPTDGLAYNNRPAHPDHVAIFLALASSLANTVPNDHCQLFHPYLTYSNLFDGNYKYTIPYNMGVNPLSANSTLGKIEQIVNDAQLDFVKFELQYLKEILYFADEERSRLLWDNNFLMAYYALLLHNNFNSENWQETFKTHSFTFTSDECHIAPNDNDQAIHRSLFIYKTTNDIASMKAKIVRFIDVWINKRNKESKHVSFSTHPKTSEIRNYELGNSLRSTRIFNNPNWMNERILDSRLSSCTPYLLTEANDSIFESMACETYIKGWNSFQKYASPYRRSGNYTPTVALNALTIIWRKQVETYKEELINGTRTKTVLATSFVEYYDNVLTRILNSNPMVFTHAHFPRIKFCFGCDTICAYEYGHHPVLYGLWIGKSEHRTLCIKCINTYYIQTNSYIDAYLPLSMYISSVHGVMPVDSTAPRYVTMSNPSISIIQDYRYDVLRVLKFQSLAEGKVQHFGSAIPGELYFGVELELEVIKGKANNEATAQALHELTGKKTVCFKRDGSIGYGFEVVSAPMTEDVHCMANNVWQQICESVHRPNMMAHSRPNLGLHIHVSRSGLSGLTIGKLIYFVNSPVNSSFISTVAGRDANSFCKKFSKTITSDVKVHKETMVNMSTDTRTQRTVSYATRDPRGGDRYQAINVLPKHTIEFRIFKSTLSWRSICAKIQFVKSLIDYVNQSSVRQLTFKEYIKWLQLPNNKGRYQFIYRWLVFKRFIERQDRFDPKLSEQGNQEGYEINMYNEQDVEAA